MSSEQSGKSNSAKQYKLGIVLQKYSGTLLALLVVVGLLSVYVISAQRKEISNPYTPQGDGFWYSSNTENVRFKIPTGWVMISPNNLSSLKPPFAEKPSIALEKIGTACVIASVKVDERRDWESAKQISFGERISTASEDQFDSNWYIASTSEASKYVFSGNARQYLPGEFRSGLFYSEGEYTSWMLYNRDSSPVSNECNSDFNTLIKTLEPYYETGRLEINSRGTLINGWVRRGNLRGYGHFTFIDETTKEKREIVRLPEGAGGFLVFQGKVYFSSTVYTFDKATQKGTYSSSFYVYNPFYSHDPLGKELEQIPGTAKDNTFISSLYIHNGTIYYLAGDSDFGFCVDGYRPCAADLYSVPVSGGTPVKIASSSLGGSILGYSEEEKAFYIMRGWGDAGCFSETLNKIVDTKEELVAKYGSCADEVESEDVREQRNIIETILKKLRSNIVASEDVYIENGTLNPSANKKEGQYGRFYFYQ